MSTFGYMAVFSDNSGRFTIQKLKQCREFRQKKILGKM